MDAPENSRSLRIICAGGFRAAMESIAPAYEESSGTKIHLTFGTPAKTRELVSAGGDFDVATVTLGSLNEQAAAQLDTSTRSTVAKSPVGMGLRAGLGKRPIGTLAEFKETLQSLSSIGLSDPNAGTNLGADIIANAERLGFGDLLKKKAQFVFGPGSYVSAEVAQGKIDAVITLASEILTVDGVTYLGPIPDEMRLGTPFVAAVARATASANLARDFLAYLRSPESQERMRRTGLQILS